MKRMNMLFAVLVVLGSADRAHAQGQRVTVVNPDTQPVPVKVVGTPTVNASVSGGVSILGTPTVNANVSGAVSIAGTPTVNANVSGEVSIAGTPTVNANVSGQVGIAGTPTVDVRSMPAVSPGAYTASCSAANQTSCQSNEILQAAPGTAFRIDAIQARNFGSSSTVTGLLVLELQTPLHGTQFEVPCINVLGFARCNATPGIHVTSIGGFAFDLSSLVATGATTAGVTVYYTVVPLAP